MIHKKPICTNILNKKQIDDLSLLCKKSKLIDKQLIPTYLHLLCQERMCPSNILYYHQQQLVGFLSAFFFYEFACEITVIVDPSYRRQGIAWHLLATIFPLLSSQQIETLFFSTAHEQQVDWLKTHKFVYQNTEYQMQKYCNHLIPIVPEVLQIRIATLEDIVVLSEIDNACFSIHSIDVANRLHNILNDSAYTIYIAHHNNQPIGKAHCHWQSSRVNLSDIAVIPSEQKKGFGSLLITHCINEALKRHTPLIGLEVESNNKNALQLYLRLGFEIANAYDFWSIPMRDLYAQNSLFSS